MSKKEKSVAIDKINMVMGDTNVELSLKQARELRDLLNETFPEPHTEYVSPTYVPVPYYCPPIIVDPPVWPKSPYKYWETTWISDETNKDLTHLTFTCQS